MPDWEFLNVSCWDSVYAVQVAGIVAGTSLS